MVCSCLLTTAILTVVSPPECERMLAQNTRLNVDIVFAVEAVLLWQHGTYEVLSNGSITTNPTIFEGDGRIQTQNACAAISSNIYYYNQPALYKTWAVAPWRGKQMLRVRSSDLPAPLSLPAEPRADPRVPSSSMYSLDNVRCAAEWLPPAHVPLTKLAPLCAVDGSLLPRMYLVSSEPSQYMFPTKFITCVAFLPRCFLQRS